MIILVHTPRRYRPTLILKCCSLIRNSKGNNKDEAKKPGEENDKEGQKDELEALLNGDEKDEA